MDFTSLKYFIVTAQTEHMTQAAQILHITQPTLSTAIRRLEAELGCRLFYRTGRGIQLNNCGRIFLEHAVQVDQIMSSCLTALRSRSMRTILFELPAHGLQPIHSCSPDFCPKG